MINRDTLQELLPPHTILEVDQDKTFISVGMHGGIITVNPLELPNDTFGQHHVNALAMGAIGLRIQDMAKITPLPNAQLNVDAKRQPTCWTVNIEGI